MWTTNFIAFGAMLGLWLALIAIVKFSWPDTWVGQTLGVLV